MADALSARGLRVEAGGRALLHEVDLDVPAGAITALVGGSGQGKTLLARALVGLAPRPGLVAGRIALRLDGRERTVFDASARGPAREAGFEAIRGVVAAYLSQHAPASLDPLLTVGRQLREAGARDIGAVLRAAGVEAPDDVASRHPHQLSGGMAQRAALARALAREARFLLADEPTTGLDPTARQAVLATLRTLCDRGAGVLLITHDLRVVPRLCDRVVFLHAGRVVETLERADPRLARAPEARALVDATARVAGGAW